MLTHSFLKKQSIVIGIIIFGMASCRPTKDDYRQDFVKGCVNKFAKDSTVASTQGRLLVEDYCNCLGDKLNDNMDADQWRQFNKKGDTTLSEFRNPIDMCKQDFRKRLEQLHP
jgi:hypothetical protein